MNEVLSLLLFSYVLSRYTLQSQKQMDERLGTWKGLGIHCLLLGIVWIILSVTFLFHGSIIVYGLLSWGAHALIDVIIIIFNKIRPLDKPYLFGLDFILHIGIIFFGVFVIQVNDFNQASSFLSDVYIKYLYNTTFWRIIVLSTGVLLLWKPANYAFKVFFGTYKPAKTDDDDTQNAGAIIGAFERIVMFAMMYINVAIAIGIVLTAKTISRYDQISKDKAFSQYYLIGTLYSITLSILIFIVTRSIYIGV
ncbi:MAG: DUF3307 domain-containing protein [Candidatus Izemoplasmatales bacterium]|jgi:hypothetical protein